MKLGLPAGIVFVVLMASCLSLVTTARADDETARLHFQAGAKEFEAGRYEAALASFSAAYELSGRPELLYNIALCHEELGRYGEAADHLRRYLDEVENVPQRTALERRIEILRKAAAAQAQQASQAEPPPPDAHDELSEAAPSSPKLPAPAWAAFGVGGASLVTGVVLASVGLKKKNELESTCGPTSSCDRDDVRRMERMGIFADVAFGVTIAAAAAGTVLLFVLRDDEEDRSVSITPWATRDGAGLSFGARFP
ncbi:MAG: tetratricopeptide repeat protein [Myxococcales bacterium]|nr:tetratricopeptide repeat protein [Myxococcales bacterium]